MLTIGPCAHATLTWPRHASVATGTGSEVLYNAVVLLSWPTSCMRGRLHLTPKSGSHQMANAALRLFFRMAGWPVDGGHPARAVALLTACVLIVAAGLKGYRLSTDPFAHDPLIPSRPASIAAVLAEFGLALWLAAGAWPAVARVAAGVTFTAFLAVSLRHALAGETSCGCFGYLTVAPWLTAALDLVLVVLLAKVGTPPPLPLSAARTRAWAGVAVFATAALIGVWLMSPDPRMARLATAPPRIDLGTMRRGERVTVAVTVSNPYETDFSSISVHSTCHCLSLRLDRPQILARSTVTGTVTLDLGKEPDFIGTLTAELRILDSADRPLLQLPVRVRVVE